MNMETTDTTNTAGSPRTPEAHQRAGGQSFEQNRIFFLNMLGAAAQAQAMKDWVLDEGITAPSVIRSAVWTEIVAERRSAATYLLFLGGLAAAW